MILARRGKCQLASATDYRIFEVVVLSSAASFNCSSLCSRELLVGSVGLLYSHSQPITPMKQESWVCSGMLLFLHKTTPLACLVPGESRSLPGAREGGDVGRTEPTEERIWAGMGIPDGCQRKETPK